MLSRRSLPAALLVTIAIACSGDSKPTPTATPEEVVVGTVVATPNSTPGTSLTPRAGVSADLGTAHRLEAEGNLEGAAESYIAVAAKSGNEKTEATLGAARVLLELERPADVRILLEPFVGSATGDGKAAHYMLARAYAALELWAESTAQYDAYIQTGRPAVPYAYLDRSRNLVELDQPAVAAQSAITGLTNMSVPPGAQRAFMVAIAQAYERAGNVTEALRWYRTLIDNSDLAGDDALALARIAAMKRELGDGTYRDDLLRLLANYPGTPQALEELQGTLDRGEGTPPTVRGLVYYRNNDYTKAEPHFREQINLSPNAVDSAEAYYFLAAILESKNDMEGAKQNYARAAQLNPQSSIADDAIWWRGRLLEDGGDTNGATQLYAQLVAQYPGSIWSGDAAFRRGSLLYQDDNYQGAVDIWAAVVASGNYEAERDRLTLWQAKARLKDDDDDAKGALLMPLATVREDDYYGVRAEGLLRDKHAIPGATREDDLELEPKFDWTAAESWLTQKTGRAISSAGWNTDYRWGRAQELWTVGRSSQGDGEIFDLIEANAQDSIAMYTMSRTLAAQGRIGMSARAGQRLLRTLNTNPNEGLPKALLSLSYPAAFASLVDKYAEDEKISPLLMLAFIRQESFFDPRAVSSAGALGLTQVLPSTAQSLASRLGVTYDSNEDLLSADLNLRLGARYMAEQLRTFNNEIFVAFSAYNAGPNAANRWRAASGDDADFFVETVEFKETRLYIELVAENYAIYRYLYGGSEIPDLPD